MKKLKAWMAEHKKFSVIALCLLLMFTCGSAMSAINVSHHRAETAKEQNAGNNTDTTTAAEKKTKEETGKVELTDAQKEIIKGYDTDTKELIDTLSSSVWSVSEGRYTLKFADDSYVETVNGSPTHRRDGQCGLHLHRLRPSTIACGEMRLRREAPSPRKRSLHRRDACCGH